MKKLKREFFQRNPKIVARELLGKIIARKLGNEILRGRIVETEAYYDEKDPASRACKKGDLKETMKMPAGTILVYGMHNNWLLNFVTGEKGKAEAVLIRAVEPLNFNGKGNGPGLLTKALLIDKRFHKESVVDNKRLGLIEIAKEEFEIAEGKRIGVTRDLDKKLRFFIKGNKWVSGK